MLQAINTLHQNTNLATQDKSIHMYTKEMLVKVWLKSNDSACYSSLQMSYKAKIDVWTVLIKPPWYVVIMGMPIIAFMCYYTYIRTY